MPFSPISEAIAELKAGRMIVLTDDDDRENEGDIVALAEHITPEQINFMLREARGMFCLALSPVMCDDLRLDLQAAETNSRFGTAFTVTVDAARGITTGSRPTIRPGHTEGSVDLARLAGAREAAVIIEILKEDGTMARLPDLEIFTRRHGMKLSCIADLVQYRRRNERLVRRVTTAKLPTRYGDFDMHLYSSPYDQHAHIVLTHGLEVPEGDAPAAAIDDPVLGRVHSECLTGDALGSLRCDCGSQLDVALKRIAQEPRGFLLYMRQEGRGIGLLNKLKAYALQDAGLDTVEANLRLGFKPDERNYGTGAQILHDLGIRRLRLLTNNPTKRRGLAGYGLEIEERVPIEVPSNPANEHYLATKKSRMGHLLDTKAVEDDPKSLKG